MEFVAPLLGTLLVELPVYLAWLAGVIIAIVTWRKHPRVSLLLILGVAILALNSIVSIAFTMLIPTILRQGRIGASEIGLISMARGTLQSIISAVAWVLIIWAIFGWRPHHIE